MFRYGFSTEPQKPGGSGPNPDSIEALRIRLDPARQAGLDRLRDEEIFEP